MRQLPGFQGHKALASGLVVLAMIAGLLGAGPAWARTVEHVMGTTEVPDQPVRVVILTNEGTEALLAMGVTPVGAVKSWTGDPWYDHIADRMEGVQVVGTESAVNLEVIAALRPDLILGNKQRQEAIYPHLSAIAPTVMSDVLRGAWQQNFATYAEALGLAEKGAEVMGAFHGEMAALSEGLGPRLDEQISVVRFMPSGTRIYYGNSFSGVILSQLGFQRPPAQDKDSFADTVTKERIPEMDGDRLFYFVYETGEGDGLAARDDWTGESLWLGLPVVQAGKVHAVDDAIWNTAGGILAARLMLDDIAQIYGLQ